jgi:hypothetical protein
MTPHKTRRNKVFISYSHKDSVWLDRLRVHLRPLERDFKLDIWDDTKIQSGAKWRKEIKRVLDEAAVAILLVSPDFLASDFIANNELPPLLKAAQEEGTVILPLILNHSSFTRHQGLSGFQAFNTPSKPLISIPRDKQAQVLEKVAERVAELMADPANVTRKKASRGRARRAGKRQPERVRVDVARSQRGGNKMSGDSPRQEDTLHNEHSSPKREFSLNYLLAIVLIGLAILTIFIVMTARRSGNRSESITTTEQPMPPPPNTPWPQLSPVQPRADIVRVTIENGDVVSVFDDSLRIYLDGIRFDVGSNQYLVTFRLSSSNVREVKFRDARASVEDEYKYPLDGKYRIHVLSAEKELADFSIEETSN